MQAALAERAHADHRPHRIGLDRGSGRANDRAAGLRQHRLAGAVQAIEAARPQDHHQIGGDPLRRYQMRKGNGRDDEFRHAERQRQGDVEREVGAHRPAERDEAVDFALVIERVGQPRGAQRHQRHRRILVTAADDRFDARIRGPGHGMPVMCRPVWRVAEHADIHHDGDAANGLDALAHEQQLVGLGIAGADHQDSPFLLHRQSLPVT